MKVPQKIHDNCPSYHPRTYVSTSCTFTNEENEEEYLYECDTCKAKIWIWKDEAIQREGN